MRIAIGLSTWIVGLLVFETCAAFTFMPTDAEWNSWPPHCKAQYVLWTTVGRGSKFVNSITEHDKIERNKWLNDGITGFHHFCAGTVYLNRSMLAQNERDREYNLQHALDETLYNMPGANRQSRYYPQLATQLARILYEQEKYEEGLVVLAEAMLAQPESDVLYSAAAIIERKLGDLEAARKTLMKGHEAVGGRSAEINYNLGLICVELGDIEAAVEYAEAAYALGYPLEGLRTKLKNLGRM